MSIWRWAEMIEPVPESARMTLGEGDTPLVRSRRIGPTAGLKNLFFKLEHGNATGSYKDRFACVAISHMLASGATKCVVGATLVLVVSVVDGVAAVAAVVATASCSA